MPLRNSKQQSTLPQYPQKRYAEAFTDNQTLSLVISDCPILKKLKKLVKEPSAKCTVQSINFLTVQLSCTLLKSLIWFLMRAKIKAFP